MNNIFWYQDESVGDVYVIDGEKKRESFGQDQKEAFNILTTDRRLVKYVPKTNDRMSARMQIFFAPISKGILVRSHFLDLDSFERRIPYMFYSRLNSLAVLDQLKGNALIAEKKLDPDDLVTLEHAVRFINRKKRNRSIALIAVTAITLTLICLCAKN